MPSPNNRNVWIIHQFAISPSDSGGTRHYSLAKELRRHGFSPTVIASATSYYTGKSRQLPEGCEAFAEEIEGVQFLWLRAATKDKKFSSRVAAMLQFVWQLLSGVPRKNLPAPTLILGSSPTIFSAAAACMLAKRYRVPFILEVRDLWPDSLIEITGYGRYHPLIVFMRLLEGWLYRNSSHIVTLLDASAPYFSAWGVPAENITVISNGVDTELLSNADMPAAPNDDFTILYLGAMGMPNALEDVIAAAALLDKRPDAARIKFHLVGDGVRRPALEEMARGLSNVRFSPAVPKKAVAETLAKADAFVLHMLDLSIYRWGVSPNKLYDYLLAARPVIFASGTKNNIVSASGGGLSIPAQDPQAIAQAALDLAAMTPQQRQQMGRNGRDYVLAHFSFQNLGERLSQVLQQYQPLGVGV